jgi:hypothetical protein
VPGWCPFWRAVNHAGGERDVSETAAEVEQAEGADAPDLSAKMRELAARSVEARREKPAALTTPEGVRHAARQVARIAVGELFRLKRAGEPIPGVLVSSATRTLEVLLADAYGRGDLLELKREAMKRTARAG